MTPERWHQVEALYQAVLEASGQERAALLAKADPQVRSDVEEILAEGSRESTLDRPAWEGVPDSPGVRMEPGAMLGPYRVEAKIGAGGMGEVYRAHDSRLGRDVAIKVSVSEFSGRFEREARAIAALNHPHICTVFDIGPNYLVMELVEGETLAARLQRGMPPLDETLKYGEQVAAALAAAHAKAIVHRDLKPANIMLSPSGVKVLDFGLAKQTGLETAEETGSLMTVPGTVAGTVPYMSPEQIRGEDLDGRSDIFSFGTLLWELLTGRNPFSGPSPADTISSILTRDPPTIPASTTLPVELRHLALKCLEKNKIKRYQSSAEIAERLSTIRTRLALLREGTALEGEPLPPPAVLAAMGSATFVGRENELHMMTAAWERAKTGQCSIILIAGEPGIGKTHLCAEFARQCSEECATVLVGRSDEQALVPYEPFIEALNWYVRMCPESDLLRHLATIGGGGELALLLPELVRRVPALPAIAPMNAEGQRFRLFETVSALLAAMSASHPVLVLFDDLHWADQPSLLMLRHLARSSGAARLCILVNYRDSEVTRRHPLAEMLADLRRESFVTRVNLAGLTEQHVGELVGSIAEGAPRPLVQAVTESSGGNPFFVGEMLRHLVETGAFHVLRETFTGKRPELGIPEGVRDVIRHRLSRLSEDCNRILSAAAVMGQEFDLALLQTLGGLPEDRLLDVVDEAVQAQLIAEATGGRDRCRFAHALIRETLYEELSGPRRARMHRRIGEAIEQLRKHDLPLADLAYHYCEAASLGVVDRAVDYAARAGDSAAASLAHEEAARFYAMALESLDGAPAGPETLARRLDLQTRRGRAFEAIGQWRLARDEFKRALEYLTEERKELHCELLVRMATVSFWLSEDIETLQGLASQALTLTKQLPDRADLAAEATGTLARCKFVSGDLEGAIALNLRAVDLAAGKPNLGHAFGTLSLYAVGRLTEAVDLGRKAASLARTAQDTGFTLYTLPHFAISLAAVGEYGEAHRVFEEAQAFGRRYGAYGAAGLLSRVVSFAAGFHLSVFDYARAEALQREARDLASSQGVAPAFISSGIDMLLTMARTHNPGPAEALLKDTELAATKHPWHKGVWTVRLSLARAELALARGDRMKAVEEATTAAGQGRVLGRMKYEVLALIVRAQAFGSLGRREDAIADTRRAVTLARRAGDPALLLRALDVMLAIEGTPELLAEARTLVSRISEALPGEAMREHFQSSETVSRVLSL